MICLLFNKLASVFYASVLLLIMNFVITLSKYSCGSADYFDNVMPKLGAITRDGDRKRAPFLVLGLAPPQRSNECACLSRARARGNGLHHFYRNKQRQNGGRSKFRGMCFISRG